MFLPAEKFVLLIALASGVPVFFIAFVSYLLYRHNNLQKRQQIEIMTAMLSTEETERKRIAQDLHDQIGPLLTGIKYQISFDNESLSEKQNTNLSKAKKELDEAITELRNVSHNLYAGNIDAIGLTNSLSEAVRNLAYSGRNLILDFSIDDKKLPYQFKSNVYRICMELINNSLKHSSSDTITLKLYQVQNQIILDYCDNGTSIQSKHTDGIGIENIKNRLKLLEAEIVSFTTDFSNGAKYEFRFKV